MKAVLIAAFYNSLYSGIFLSPVQARLTMPKPRTEVLSVPAGRNNSGDSIFITVNFYGNDSIQQSEFKLYDYLFEQLISDFRKRGEKLKTTFFLNRSGSLSAKTGYSLFVTFTNLQIGPEQKEQSSRFVSRTVSKTTHDKELMEHKIGSEVSRTEVIRIKKILPCSIIVDVELKENPNLNILINKSFSGSYTWVNEYITYTGSEELLTREEQKLFKAGEQVPPAKPTLIKKLEEEICRDITAEFNKIFTEKKGF